VEVQFHAFLTLALDEGKRLASRPGLRIPDTHCMRLGEPQNRYGHGGEEKNYIIATAGD